MKQDERRPEIENRVGIKKAKIGILKGVEMRQRKLSWIAGDEARMRRHLSWMGCNWETPVISS